MSTAVAVSLGLAVGVGLVLGAVGGGGSILTLPILVDITGIPAQKAVPMSMIVVGMTSLLGAVLHGGRGHFHLKAAGLFAATGVVAAYLGSFLTQMVSQRILLGLFAALMLGTGIGMMRGRPEGQSSGQCKMWRCLGIGAIVGGLTGFLGVGGGFMIVPALVLFAGIETKDAVGTSLAIICINAAAGFLGQIQRTSLDWPLTLGFLGLTILGMFGGLVVAEKVSEKTLKSAFGWLVLGLAVVIGGLAAAGGTGPTSGPTG